ncbi:hypothetical protein FH620_42825, partial [Corallococcus exiguus]
MPAVASIRTRPRWPSARAAAATCAARARRCWRRRRTARPAPSAASGTCAPRTRCGWPCSPTPWGSCSSSRTGCGSR